MKYTPEITAEIAKAYEANTPVEDIANSLSVYNDGVAVPIRSVIAKLSSLGIYKKKEYLTKRGELPIKKEEYITRIAALLDVNAEILESMEKCNKHVLQLLELKLNYINSEKVE